VNYIPIVYNYVYIIAYKLPAFTCSLKPEPKPLHLLEVPA